jgi:hypothetical protein
MSVGTHSLSAIETDDAGNSSTTSGPIAITVTAADPGPDGSPTPNWPSDTTIIGGLIEIKSGASAGLISFSGGGTLQLDDSAHFTGKISGFAAPDQLDLRDISFGAGTTITFAEFEDNTQGTLTVSDGAHVAQIVMAGSM